MSLTSRQRAELRSRAHHLQPAVQIGQQGVTPALVESLQNALRARELVKVHLGRNAGLDVRDTANALADAAGADVVQVIGRTFTLYRENPELHKDH